MYLWLHTYQHIHFDTYTYIYIYILIHAHVSAGSTGRPKGVMIRHRGLTSMQQWHQVTYKHTATDKSGQMIGKKKKITP